MDFKKHIDKNLELVLDCVIPYIQNNHDLNSVSLVSTTCHDIDSLTRKHLTAHVHFLSNPSRLSCRFPNLESLRLKNYSYGGSYATRKCHLPVTPWIQEIAVKFPRLNTLSIRNMVVSPSDLKLLAKTRGANLRSLEIRGCMFSGDGLIDIARCCIDLRYLRLEYNWMENDNMLNGEWLHELALCNTVMESLNFYYPFHSYDMKDVTCLAKKCSNSLVYLNIYPQPLINCRKVFKHAKKLDHFGYGFIDEDSDYNGFKFPPNIRGLCIEDLNEASFPFLLPYLNQLRELNLVYHVRQHDCQCFFFERCPNLEVLVTDDICGDIGLQVIGLFCKRLRKLTYYGRMTQMGLIALARGFLNLEYLEVDTLIDISNEALECVGTHLKNLRDFRTFSEGEVRITADLPLDNGVQAMLMDCSKLERLRICFGGLTDVGVGYIGKYGHNLTDLSLINTGEYVGLLELSKGCPNLRKLRLGSCPFSKQAVATFVFNNNHSLRYVWIEHSVLTRPMVYDEVYFGQVMKNVDEVEDQMWLPGILRHYLLNIQAY